MHARLFNSIYTPTRHAQKLGSKIHRPSHTSRCRLRPSPCVKINATSCWQTSEQPMNAGASSLGLVATSVLTNRDLRDQALACSVQFSHLFRGLLAVYT